jgi:CubicO group peptidase (beta-lactamase class C family)
MGPPSFAGRPSRPFGAIENANNAYQCAFPLPNLLSSGPPFEHGRNALSVASRSLDKYLRAKVRQRDIDSLSIAVVTPNGPIFQKGYGVLRANETDSKTPDANSIYRIASISKMFTVLETLVLRDRGVLDW